MVGSGTPVASWGISFAPRPGAAGGDVFGLVVETIQDSLTSPFSILAGEQGRMAEVLTQILSRKSKKEMGNVGRPTKSRSVTTDSRLCSPLILVSIEPHHLR